MPHEFSNQHVYFSAIAKGQPIEFVKLLQQYGANFRTHLGTFNPLQYAAEKDVPEAIDIVMKEVPDLLNVLDKDKLTPLGWAANSGHVNCIDKLVDHGADVHAMSFSGYSVMYFAVTNHHHDAIRALARRGASLETQEPGDFGATALYRAILMHESDKYLETVQVLLECGANVNGTTKSGWRPVHYAAKYNLIDVLEGKRHSRLVTTNCHILIPNTLFFSSPQIRARL